MELKLYKIFTDPNNGFLLIVPYGIETARFMPRLQLLPLLIVPYGIETSDLKRYLGTRYTLLIVPYGIETIITDEILNKVGLLIVPYGIETRARLNNLTACFRF